MLAGLSTRSYLSGLESGGETVETEGAPPPCLVSGTPALCDRCSRPPLGVPLPDLSSHGFLVVFADGFGLAGYTLGALGVRANGTRISLGVMEGSTENAFR